MDRSSAAPERRGLRRSASADREQGLFVPVDEAPGYLACGWRPSSDAAFDAPWNGRVLLIPPRPGRAA